MDQSSIFLEEPLFHQKAKSMLVCKCLNRTMTIEHLRMAEAQAPLYIYHPDQHHILQTQILGFRQTRGLIVTTGTHLIVNEVTFHSPV